MSQAATAAPARAPCPRSRTRACRVDLLGRRQTDDERCELLDLSPLLAAPRSGPVSFAGDPLPQVEGGELGALLAEAGRPALTDSAIVEPSFRITTDDRTVGAR